MNNDFDPRRYDKDGLCDWEREMTAVAHRQRPGLSIETFRAFYESRPDEEHWELIEGVAMMMAPATKAHQR